MLTGTGRCAAGERNFRTFIFRPAFFHFSTIQTHAEAFFADGYTVLSDGKVILVNRRSASFAVKVNKGCYSVCCAILIKSHSIMGRVQKEFCDLGFRQELFHGEEVIAEAMGIMPGCGSKQWKYRQVIRGVRGSEHVKVIAEIMAFPV